MDVSGNLQWTVGAATITRVEEGVRYVDATQLMPDFTTSHLDLHRDWLVPNFFSDVNEKMLLSIHSFVVQSAGTTIVVDTCVGRPNKPLPHDPAFVDRLAASIPGGLEAVDFVLCTHLHFDHVGWNTRIVDGVEVPTFPKARYLFARAEIEHAQVDDSHRVLESSVEPLIAAGLVDLVETNHRLTTEATLVATPGHTPGHVSVLIESQGAVALITGDLAHSPIQFAIPDLASAAFDFDSAQATATRREVLARFGETDTLVLGTHFAPPTAGVLRSVDGSMRLVTGEPTSLARPTPHTSAERD